MKLKIGDLVKSKNFFPRYKYLESLFRWTLRSPK